MRCMTSTRLMRAAPAGSTRPVPRPRSTTSIRRSPSATPGRSPRARSTRRGRRAGAATPATTPHSGPAALPTDSVGPAVSIAGVASFGTLSGSPTRRVNTLYELVDNLSHQAGAHALRAGVDLLYNDDTITYPRSIRGAYTFSSLANFLSGAYNSNGFVQTFGTTVVGQTNPNVGIYAQDEWKITPGLTLNAGLRYDLQYLQTIRTDRNNLAPRAGLVWSPFASRRTVVRAAGGVFYDRVPL